MTISFISYLFFSRPQRSRNGGPARAPPGQPPGGHLNQPPELRPRHLSRPPTGSAVPAIRATNRQRPAYARRVHNSRPLFECDSASRGMRGRRIYGTSGQGPASQHPSRRLDSGDKSGPAGCQRPHACHRCCRHRLTPHADGACALKALDIHVHRRQRRTLAVRVGQGIRLHIRSRPSRGQRDRSGSRLGPRLAARCRAGGMWHDRPARSASLPHRRRRARGGSDP